MITISVGQVIGTVLLPLLFLSTRVTCFISSGPDFAVHSTARQQRFARARGALALHPYPDASSCWLLEDGDDTFKAIKKDCSVLATEFALYADRQTLEEKWSTAAKKSKPRFLPFAECKKWARAQNMWTTQEEWEEWISLGEKNANLVPSDPEKYYRSVGTWTSWDDFLGNFGRTKKL